MTKLPRRPLSGWSKYQPRCVWEPRSWVDILQGRGLHRGRAVRASEHTFLPGTAGPGLPCPRPQIPGRAEARQNLWAHRGSWPILCYVCKNVVNLSGQGSISLRLVHSLELIYREQNRRGAGTAGSRRRHGAGVENNY